MANERWQDRVTRGLERGGTFAGAAIGRGAEGAVSLGATRTEEWCETPGPSAHGPLQGGLTVSHQARAMARGGAAYWDGLPCVPPDNESVLTAKAWVRGWEHAYEDSVCPGCPDCEP